MIQIAGLVILFYEIMPYLTMMGALAVSTVFYILPMLGRCIWTYPKIESACSLDRKALTISIDVGLLVIQGTALIAIIFLFGNSDEWGQWKIATILLLGIIFTIFGWLKTSLIVKNRRTHQCSTRDSENASRGGFVELLICIWRIIVFAIGTLLLCNALELTDDWKELFVILKGYNSVFISTTVSKNYI